MHAGADLADDGAVPRRARGLVIVALCLLLIAEAGYGTANGGPAEGLFVLALFTGPILYVIPVTRHLWAAHRCQGPGKVVIMQLEAV
jgi:hypothetical protein